MKLLIVVFLISSCISSISAQNSAKCDPQDSLFGNKCYRFVNNIRNFTSAVDYCRGIGYSLTSIHSIAENNFLRVQSENVFEKTHHNFYIGLYSPSKNINNWVYVDGSAYDFTNWNKGEPSGSRWYVAFRISDGKWITVSNSASIPFVCSAASNNTSPANTTVASMTTTSSGVVCPGCTQVITDDAYWREGEGAQLCGGDNMAVILQRVHGPPTITPIPNSDPCSETIMCDPARYDAFIAITYIIGFGFNCDGETVDLLNNYLNPYQCNTTNSNFFTDSDDANGIPIKALLCYLAAELKQ